MFGNWLFRRMYWWQVGRFIRDADVRREFVPLLYQQFDATPSARPAFFRLNEDLLPTVRSRTQKIPKLKEFRRPVRIIFGDADPSLNSGVARAFHEFLPGSELFLIPGARHFVQLDEPEQVARVNPGHARAAEHAGLMPVTKSATESRRRLASYVDRIVRGEKPTEFPAQAPTKYGLAINFKAAKPLGLGVPPTLFVRHRRAIR